MRHSKIIGEKQGRRVRNGQFPGHETRVSGVKGNQLLLEKIFTSVKYIFSWQDELITRTMLFNIKF